MARQTWDEEQDWDDADEDDFAGDFADESTMPCPYCGSEIHADSPRCPSCENYLSLEDAPPTPAHKKPWWVLLGVGLGLLVFLRWLFV
ncbi:MAG: hypothetical protein ACKV2Q_19770 [Planctomycetaceae bacterium]